MIYVYSNRASDGARELSELGSFRRIKRRNSKFRPGPGKTVINWGCTRPEINLGNDVLNKPDVVHRVCNKLNFFSDMHGGPRVVPWTDVREIAKDWLEDGNTVVCRTMLTGHSGYGILLVSPDQDLDDLPEAPLYTKYIKKDSEYRLHYINGDLIDIQKKIRDPDKEPTNWQVRSHQNGFMFIRENFEIPPEVVIESKKAFEKSSLDFGAVDVIYNRRRNEAYVLEINSAPGMTGKTLENYANGFKKHYG